MSDEAPPSTSASGPRVVVVDDVSVPENAMTCVCTHTGNCHATDGSRACKAAVGPKNIAACACMVFTPLTNAQRSKAFPGDVTNQPSPSLPDWQDVVTWTGIALSIALHFWDR